MQNSQLLHRDCRDKQAYSVQGHSWSLVPDVIIDRRVQGISLCPLDSFLRPGCCSPTQEKAPPVFCHITLSSQTVSKLDLYSLSLIGKANVLQQKTWRYLGPFNDLVIPSAFLLHLQGYNQLAHSKWYHTQHSSQQDNLPISDATVNQLLWESLVICSFWENE